MYIDENGEDYNDPSNTRDSRQITLSVLRSKDLDMFTNLVARSSAMNELDEEDIEMDAPIVFVRKLMEKPDIGIHIVRYGLDVIGFVAFEIDKPNKNIGIIHSFIDQVYAENKSIVKQFKDSIRSLMRLLRDM